MTDWLLGLRNCVSATSRIAGLIDRWNWLLLIIAAPFLLFPSTGNWPAIMILPAVWIAGFLTKHEPAPPTPLNLTILVLVMMLLVSEWATFDLMFSLPKITGVVLGVGAFLAVVRAVRTPLGWWIALLAFLFVGLSISVFGLFGTSWAAKIAALSAVSDRFVLRVKGIPGIEEGLSPNQLAGALIWVLPVLIVLSGLALAGWRSLWAPYGRRVRAAVVFCVFCATGLMLFVFVLTECRGAYIGFTLAMLSVGCASLPRQWRRHLLVVVLASVAGLAILWWQGSLAALGDRISASVLGDSPALSLTTMESRLDIWTRAIYGIQDFPFTGMGMNTFRKVVHVLYPLFTVSPDFEIGHAHNEYLQAALDLGIPGLVAFLSIQVVTFVMLFRTWRIAGAPAAVEVSGPYNNTALDDGRLVTRSLALGLGSGLFAHMLFGLTDGTALGAKPGILLWMLLGLSTSLYLRVNAGGLLTFPDLREFRSRTGRRGS